MIIRVKMIILPLYIVINYCLTKTSELTFSVGHNVQLQLCSMGVTTSVRAQSWYDNVRVCSLTHFVSYPIHKFRLASSFSYLWLWHIFVLTLFHVLSADYICVRIVHLFYFFLCLHDVGKFLRTIFLCIHVVSCLVFFCIHAGFCSFSSCIHVGLYLLLVLPNLNHISNNIYWPCIISTCL